MITTRFCLKANAARKDTLSALENLLKVDCDLLVFGYGYMYNSLLVESYVLQLVNWLKVSPKRTIEFYIGVIPDPRVPLEHALIKEAADVLERLQMLFPPAMYESGTTDRISFTALAGFHCKFALGLKHVRDDEYEPVAGVFGSTNMTSSALSGETRFELDLLIGPDTPLLQDFKVAVEELLHDAVESSELSQVGMRMYDSTFTEPAFAQALDEATKERLMDELYHRDEKLDEDEQTAHVDSDKDQELYTVWPDKFLRTFTVNDLEKAKQEVKLLEDEYRRSFGKDLGVLDAKHSAAAEHARLVEADLRRRGLIARTDAERLQNELDEIYPNALSKQTVAHKGLHYQIVYFKANPSGTGETAKKWNHKWIMVPAPTK